MKKFFKKLAYLLAIVFVGVIVLALFIKKKQAIPQDLETLRNEQQALEDELAKLKKQEEQIKKTDKFKDADSALEYLNSLIEKLKAKD